MNHRIQKALSRRIFILVVLSLSPSASRLVAAQESVADVKHCLLGNPDDAGNVSISNHCQWTVAATWFFGSSHHGFARIAAGQKEATGVNVADITALGALRFFACPVGTPVFRSNSGGPLISPDVNFQCAPLQPHHWPPNGPRMIKFDLQTSGDCVLENGRVVLDPGGRGRWTSYIHTNHTTNRDIWHLTFAAFSVDGELLFPIVVGDSPSMFGSPSPVIPWAVEFRFDPAKFQSVDDVMITRSSC